MLAAAPGLGAETKPEPPEGKKMTVTVGACHFDGWAGKSSHAGDPNPDGRYLKALNSVVEPAR